MVIVVAWPLLAAKLSPRRWLIPFAQEEKEKIRKAGTRKLPQHKDREAIDETDFTWKILLITIYKEYLMILVFIVIR